jgi:hypothetical protein
MSLYESFLKEAVETLQIVKDEVKTDPVSVRKLKATVIFQYSLFYKDIQTHSASIKRSW